MLLCDSKKKKNQHINSCQHHDGAGKCSLIGLFESDKAYNVLTFTDVGLAGLP